MRSPPHWYEPALVLVLVGCSSTSSTAPSSAPSSSSSSGTVASGTTCDSDPLKTGIVTQQTGISADAYDCAILKSTADNAEPDAMIFKAIIYVESRFDASSVACPNLPCGMPDGWNDDESRCYGLMQIVPACKGAPNTPAILPNGHPDLEKDASAADWGGSVFNPDTNIAVGVAGLADNRRQMQEKFPGCTVEQYTMMAVGSYNSYGSTKSCTEYNHDYDKLVIDAYTNYSTAAGYAAHTYTP